MSSSTTTSLSLAGGRDATIVSRLSDYVELTKPRIAFLVLITVGVSGYLAAWGQPNLWSLLHAMVGVTFIASSASALNHWLERDLDARMPRTADRPLPAGRLSSWQAVSFGAVCLITGLVYLVATTNPAAAGWALATWVFYVGLYTPLKTRTASNTAVGAVAGALPTMIGWTACGGEMDVRAAAMFMILFLWQFPHFMAIAWLYREQYERGGFVMLTVVDPSGRRAGVQAVLSALALLPVSLVPALLTPGVHGGAYVVSAFVLGVLQLLCAARFLRNPDASSARTLLTATLIYLPALMLLLVLSPFI